MDRIFIVEFIWRVSHGSNLGGESGYENALLYDNIMHDLMLLENQLPFFVLKGLGDHSFPGNNQGWIVNLTPLFIQHFDLMRTADLNMSHNSLLDSLGTCNIMHLVDFIRCISNFSTSATYRGQKLELSCSSTELQLVDQQEACFNAFRGPMLQLSRSATELQEAGVKLGCAEDLSLTNIVFMENGVLLIPRVAVKRNTESLFRNIIAFEHCYRKDNKFRSYVILMDCLINTSQDVQLLVDLGIIENSLGTSEDGCTLFNSLYKMPMMESSTFHYGKLCQRLNEYSRDPWHKWKATWFKWKSTLKRDYFSSPWSIFSVIAAFLFLGLTTIQTKCSIKGVKW